MMQMLRPTQVPVVSLADTAALAGFVSSYIEYQPLPQPYLMPSGVQLPAETLRTRRGNALEMAVLLASLLLGQGFDAAVVIGYAQQDVISNVQASQQCPAPSVKRRLDIQRQVQAFLAGCSGGDVAAAAQRQAFVQGTSSPHADRTSAAYETAAYDPAADGVAADCGAAATAGRVEDAVQSEAAASGAAAATPDVPPIADASATGPASAPAHEQQTSAESAGQAAEGEAEVSAAA